MDRSRRSEPHGPGQRRRRLRVIQRRHHLVIDLQPADRAVLSHRHRQPLSLPRLRHTAGQHVDRGAQRRRTGVRSRSATAPIPAPAKAASSPCIPTIPTSSIAARSAPARAVPGRCNATTTAPARSSSSMSGPRKSTGIAPKDMKYRFAWTYPIVFSPHDSSVLYAGGNHVFRTTQRRHELGGDLARPQPERRVAAGRTRAATSPTKAPAPRCMRHAPAWSNRRIARARSGPRPMMAWCT